MDYHTLMIDKSRIKEKGAMDMVNVNVIEMMTRTEAREKDIHISVSKGVTFSRVIVLKRTRGERATELTTKALEDKGYKVGTWYIAEGKQARNDCNAIVVLQANRISQSQFESFHHFISETDKTVVIIASPTNQDDWFWEWAARQRINIV